jgi:hypothetical protein
MGSLDAVIVRYLKWYLTVVIVNSVIINIVVKVKLSLYSSDCSVSSSQNQCRPTLYLKHLCTEVILQVLDLDLCQSCTEHAALLASGTHVENQLDNRRPSEV